MILSNRLLLFSLFFGLFFSTQAQQEKTQIAAVGGVDFFEGSWEDAVKKAQEEGKFLMIDAYTDWCHWCKVMDKNTFSESRVGDFFRENIVAYKMDMEKGRGIDMAMKYRVMSFPSFLFFSADGPLVARVMGYREPTDFLQILNEEVMNPEKHFKHPGDPAKLKVAFPDFYKNSYKRGKERQMPAEDEVISFLDQQEDLFGEISWSVMSRFSFPGKYWNHLMDNIDTYKELFGNEVDRIIDSRIYRMVMQAAKDQDEGQLEEAIRTAREFNAEKNPEALELSYRMAYAARTKNWESFGEQTVAMMELDIEKSNSQINSYAWDIYLHVADENIVKQAAGWMEKVVEDDPDDYAFMDTYAALLFKAGDFKNAEKYAKKAIKIGKKNGDKVAETEELLQKIKDQ